MITTKEEYFANLDILQNVNLPAYALLPEAGTIYHINSITREIDKNEIVIVEKDHKSKTIYFSIDRFNDYMDLSHTCCIIQYNVNERTKFYPVPFYDIYTKADENKIIFPWNLDYNVTKTPGAIPFSIRFFKIGNKLTERNDVELILTYNLNTIPSQIVVKKALNEMQINKDDESYLQPTDKEILMQYIDYKMQTLSRKIYWSVLSDEFTGDKIDVSMPIQDDVLDVLEEMEEKTEKE